MAKRKKSSSKSVTSDASSSKSKKSRRSPKPATVEDEEVEFTARFQDEPIPDSEAKTTWPDRYLKPEVLRKMELEALAKENKKKKKKKKENEEEEEEEEEDLIPIQARRHFCRAIVDDKHEYKLNDDAHVCAGEGNDPFICKVVELFEGVDGQCYFCAQWFYRAFDTNIGLHKNLINDKRVFFSEVRNTNPLCTLLRKLEIPMIPLSMNTEETVASLRNFDYFCDMKYLLPYSTFEALSPNAKMAASDTSTISIDSTMSHEEACVIQSKKTDASLLDLYSGCGAMSTGLCMGAQLADMNLVTKWAVDVNEDACRSLKHNHEETLVRNDSAEDFLLLLKEWEKLCFHFSLKTSLNSEQYVDHYEINESKSDEDDDGCDELDDADDGEVFVVEKILDICFGDPNKKEKPGLYMKVRWENYGPQEDSWEPIEGLSNCREKIKEFVIRGYETCFLPLPGRVDVICGGPPCQGVSGFNRHREEDDPLRDDKNKQMLVYMEIVNFLKPKYILMENVVDILKFAKGYLGRYAIGKLVQMNYQTRMGMMAAGSYGLAQFRMRFFLWGAQPGERLPQFPLPTHDVVVRGNVPVEFKACLVAYEGVPNVNLAQKLQLSDIIKDLPAVENDETNNEIPYDKEPETPFQKYIRLRKDGSTPKINSREEAVLFDHQPLNLNKYDYQRVCRVPKKKGACFRDFPGVIVGYKNKVEWDSEIPRVYLDSNNKHPLVPDYAMSYILGTSSKPFGRLWWDETVPTVVTRAEPHNQVIIHPEQDRVLTVRENARLQGFQDHYKLIGSTKAKYTQVGNAVAIPVAKALGFALGKAFLGLANGDPLFTLPEGFPNFPAESSEQSR